MTREDESLSQVHPEVAAVEAAWAQLRPQRQERLANTIKDHIDAVLLEQRLPAAASTTTVRIPLAHYIRLTQFNAAAAGVLVGLFVGMLLAGAGFYFMLDRLVAERVRQVQTQYTAHSAFVRFISEQGEPGPVWDQTFNEPSKPRGHDDVRAGTEFRNR